MNMVLLPMWMGSGMFSSSDSSAWLKAFMAVNPFTYGLAGVRRGLFSTQDMGTTPSLGTCLVVLAGFAIFFYTLSSWVVEKSKKGSMTMEERSTFKVGLVFGVVLGGLWFFGLSGLEPSAFGPPP